MASNEELMRDAIIRVRGAIQEHSRMLLNQEQGPKVESEPETYDSTAYSIMDKLYHAQGQDKTNSDTEWAQKFLREVGYYDGPIDGFYGKDTQNAINRYTMNKSHKHMFSILKGKWDNLFSW